MKLLIVCADKDLRKDLSKALATELKYLYLDVNDILDYEILNGQDIGLEDAGEALRKMERYSIGRAMGYDNCVATISHDLFVANDNFELIKSDIKIYILLSKGYLVARTKKEDKHKLEQELSIFNEINVLIGANCDLVIEKGAKSIDELCQEIVNNLNHKK